MTEKQLLREIGRQIRKIRTDKGLSQSELAALLDYEKSNMSRLESGTLNVKVVTLYKVSKALNVTLSELLDFGRSPTE